MAIEIFTTAVQLSICSRTGLFTHSCRLLFTCDLSSKSHYSDVDWWLYKCEGVVNKVVDEGRFASATLFLNRESGWSEVLFTFESFRIYLLAILYFICWIHQSYSDCRILLKGVPVPDGCSRAGMISTQLYIIWHATSDFFWSVYHFV